MKNLKSRVLACAAALGFCAMSGAAHADPMTTPSMAGPLAANPNPFSIDTTDWLGDAGGKIYITSAVSGLFYGQTNATHFAHGDADTFVDLDNAHVFIQKTDGWLQFFVDVGTYSFPTVGIAYLDQANTPSGHFFTSGSTTPFGYVPVAYAKLAGQGDLSPFSIEAGKLPTLIGNEYGFTFQNMNIERGILWNFEPIVSRGVQVNYSAGPLNVSVSLNDGTYTNIYNELSGLVSYAFNGGADTIAIAGGGQVGGSFHPGTVTKVGFSNAAVNYGSVFNVIYTHTSGPWTISPYLQINTTPSTPLFPGLKGGTMVGGAILSSYSFDDNWKLAGRLEYISADSNLNPMLFNYGRGADAFTATLTPTYQWKWLYARADLSYVTLGHASPGQEFGSPVANRPDQFRGMLEVGVLY